MGGPAGRRILVVDDDERVRTMVSWQLESDGFAVQQAGDGAAALRTIGTDRPDLVVLDLTLPGVGGLDVLRRLRDGGAAGEAALPVIVLSGRAGETDRILGLGLGADDYLVKPFSPGELSARVRSVLRRSDPAPAPETGGLRVDCRTREAHVADRLLELTAKEFDLLAFLVRHPRQVFSRGQLLAAVWNDGDDWPGESTVTEHVHRLRQKVEDDAGSPRHLLTLRGVGYRLEP